MTRPSPNPSLQHLAEAALADFGIQQPRLTLLANRHNDVFRVDTPTGQRFVLRIQNYLMTNAQARSQIQWLASLATHADLLVPAPLRTLNDQPFTFVESDSGKRRAVLLRWLPGSPARLRHDATYRAAARMIARLHRHAETFTQPRGFSCRHLDADWLFGPRLFARSPRSRRHLNASHRKTLASAETLVRNAMKKLGHSKRRFGIIHADLNLDNIIFDRRRPSPIDFDEFGKGWYLFDLAELIRTSITPDNWQQRKQLAISTYTDQRQLDDTEVHAFNAFIVATFVQYLNWAVLHARTDEDLKWVGFCMNVVRRIIQASA